MIDTRLTMASGSKKTRNITRHHHLTRLSWLLQVALWWFTLVSSGKSVNGSPVFGLGGGGGGGKGGAKEKPRHVQESQPHIQSDAYDHAPTLSSSHHQHHHHHLNSHQNPQLSSLISSFISENGGRREGTSSSSDGGNASSDDSGEFDGYNDDVNLNLHLGMTGALPEINDPQNLETFIPPLPAYFGRRPPPPIPLVPLHHHDETSDEPDLVAVDDADQVEHEIQEVELQRNHQPFQFHSWLDQTTRSSGLPYQHPIPSLSSPPASHTSWGGGRSLSQKPLSMVPEDPFELNRRLVREAAMAASKSTEEETTSIGGPPYTSSHLGTSWGARGSGAHAHETSPSLSQGSSPPAYYASGLNETVPSFSRPAYRIRANLFATLTDLHTPNDNDYSSPPPSTRGDEQDDGFSRPNFDSNDQPQHGNHAFYRPWSNSDYPGPDMIFRARQEIMDDEDADSVLSYPSLESRRRHSLLTYSRGLVENTIRAVTPSVKLASKIVTKHAKRVWRKTHGWMTENVPILWEKLQDIIDNLSKFKREIPKAHPLSSIHSCVHHQDTYCLSLWFPHFDMNMFSQTQLLNIRINIIPLSYSKEGDPIFERIQELIQFYAQPLVKVYLQDYFLAMLHAVFLRTYEAFSNQAGSISTESVEGFKTSCQVIYVKACELLEYRLSNLSDAFGPHRSKEQIQFAQVLKAAAVKFRQEFAPFAQEAGRVFLDDLDALARKFAERLRELPYLHNDVFEGYVAYVEENIEKLESLDEAALRRSIAPYSSYILPEAPPSLARTIMLTDKPELGWRLAKAAISARRLDMFRRLVLDEGLQIWTFLTPGETFASSESNFLFFFMQSLLNPPARHHFGGPKPWGEAENLEALQLIMENGGLRLVYHGLLMDAMALECVSIMKYLVVDHGLTEGREQVLYEARRIHHQSKKLLENHGKVIKIVKSQIAV